MWLVNPITVSHTILPTRQRPPSAPLGAGASLPAQRAGLAQLLHQRLDAGRNLDVERGVGHVPIGFDLRDQHTGVHGRGRIGRPEAHLVGNPPATSRHRSPAGAARGAHLPGLTGALQIQRGLPAQVDRGPPAFVEPATRDRRLGDTQPVITASRSGGANGTPVSAPRMSAALACSTTRLSRGSHSTARAGRAASTNAGAERRQPFQAHRTLPRESSEDAAAQAGRRRGPKARVPPSACARRGTCATPRRAPRRIGHGHAGVTGQGEAARAHALAPVPPGSGSGAGAAHRLDLLRASLILRRISVRSTSEASPSRARFQAAIASSTRP